jgi:hypothetical protein
MCNCTVLLVQILTACIPFYTQNGTKKSKKQKVQVEVDEDTDRVSYICTIVYVQVE